VAVAVIGILGVTPMASAGTRAGHSRFPIAANAAGTVTSQRSAYWAGYVAVPPPSGYIYFKYVTATFTVPAISSCLNPYSGDVSQYAGLSGNWVLPDGFPLQAAGVYETCSAGSLPAYYGAYWNVSDNGASDDLPGQNDGPTEVFPVSPGDVIFASVYFSGPPPGKDCGGMNCQEYDTWQVTDETTGQTWKQKLSCYTNDIGNGVSSCDTNTAEVITQGEPNNEGSGGGTPPFGKINFSAIKVTDNKQTGARAMVNSGWITTKVVEYGTVTFKPDVIPGTLTSTTTKPLQSAFTNTWKREN